MTGPVRDYIQETWKRWAAFIALAVFFAGGIWQVRETNQRSRREICAASENSQRVVHDSLHLLTTEEEIATDPDVAAAHAQFHRILDDAVPAFCVDK